MPARNSIKKYQEQGIYHVYNRGVEKRDIFLDEEDHRHFLWLLKTYLSPLEKGSDPFSEPSSLERSNFTDEIDLMAYCLMPNHFHFLIRQKNLDSMARFMKCLATNYSMYFNKKYDRVGALFQGRYKAILVKEEPYLIHLSRYIHLNPYTSKGSDPFEGQTHGAGDVQWTSYGDYLGLRDTIWLKPRLILGLFDQGVGLYGDCLKSYKSFVEEYQKDSTEIIGKLALE